MALELEEFQHDYLALRRLVLRGEVSVQSAKLWIRSAGTNAYTADQQAKIRLSQLLVLNRADKFCDEEAKERERRKLQGIQSDDEK